ncbi:hypothetical protein FA13DRAFT_1727201 [Coprinellus micaceus]|uniref:Uncharacterized protein n=1 Tax=Coprinellus micaceus TaxID=71717 RepID=A0A4Y7TRM4_COPMI|nr:hypothetical protein FA13DRAFT_1727201 [Coprinellus micaceus]
MLRVVPDERPALSVLHQASEKFHHTISPEYMLSRILATPSPMPPMYPDAPHPLASQNVDQGGPLYWRPVGIPSNFSPRFSCFLNLTYIPTTLSITPRGLLCIPSAWLLDLLHSRT